MSISKRCFNVAVVVVVVVVVFVVYIGGFQSRVSPWLLQCHLGNNAYTTEKQ
jgi:hypothetical protein